jgi:DNA-binding MarR family transcriptional regulator
VDEIARIVERRDERLSTATAFPERSLQRGYADWSATYVDAGGPTGFLRNHPPTSIATTCALRGERARGRPALRSATERRLVRAAHRRLVGGRSRERGGDRLVARQALRQPSAGELAAQAGEIEPRALAADPAVGEVEDVQQAERGVTVPLIGERYRGVEGHSGYLLRQAWHTFRAAMDAALREHGLTSPQYAALTVLARDPGSSAADLARACNTTPQAMRGVLATLRREGLVDRRPHPTHGRVVQLTLSDEGERRLRGATPAVRALEADIARHLPRGPGHGQDLAHRGRATARAAVSRTYAMKTGVPTGVRA